MKHLLALGVAVITSTLWAAQPRIAILSTGNGPRSHHDEWASALDELKWTATAVHNDEQLATLETQLDQYDMLLVAPLFKGKVQSAEAYMNFLKRGGLIVVTDGRYLDVRQWMLAISPDLGGVAVPNGDCNSSQWFVNGYVQDANEQNPHPIRTFPKRILEPNHWGHFGESSNPKWQLLARCSEGKPVLWYQSIGQGHFIYSALRQYTAAHLLNWMAWQNLSRAGVKLKSFEMSPRQLGNGIMTLTYEKLNRNVPIELFTPGRSFKGILSGTEGKLRYRLETRGHQKLTLKVAGQIIFEEPIRLPYEVEVESPMGRRALSTERRMSDTLYVPVDLYPLDETFAARFLELNIFDSKGKPIGPVTSTKIGRNLHLIIPIKVTKPLDAGIYTVVASLPKRVGQDKYQSTNTFHILPPRKSQTLIDQDATLLVDGKPFFPLGFYHVPNEELENVQKLGANTVQFWAWQGREGMDKLKSLGLKALFENNQPGYIAYEHRLHDFRDHEALLMWYIADEPTDCNALICRLRHQYLMKNDLQHPTYILSCRPDLFGWASQFGEVLAFDSYDAIKNTALRSTEAAVATKDRKPIIAVLPCWGNTNGIKINPDRLRQRAFLALACGVRGILWYPWKQAGGGPLGVGLIQAPQDWPAYEALIKEIKELTPELTAFYRQRYQWGDIYGLHCQLPNGRHALIYANATDQAVQAQCRLPGRKAPRQLSLKPYQCGVIRW